MLVVVVEVHRLKVRRLVLVVVVEEVLVAVEQLELLALQILVVVVAVEEMLLILLPAQAAAV
jgi:hypothetical protein